MSGQAISSTAFNTLETDIGTEITNSVDRGGRSAMTAALPMGGQKITGMADPSVSTDGATKNYVDTTTAAFFSTGDVKLTFKTAADSGWLLFDDGTFGSASSGSSNSNNVANLALFTLFFNAPFTDANLPILTSGGGATTRAAQVSASAAWAANCRMSLPKTLGRALAISGSGSGLTSRVLGSAIGLETATLAQANLPNVNFTGATTGNITVLSSTTAFVNIASSAGTSSVALTTGAVSIGNAPVSAASGGSATPVAVMPPEIFLNVMVKL